MRSSGQGSVFAPAQSSSYLAGCYGVEVFYHITGARLPTLSNVEKRYALAFVSVWVKISDANRGDGLE